MAAHEIAKPHYAQIKKLAQQIDRSLDATAGIRGLKMKMSLERAQFFP
jgi:hypothetical protein